MHAKSSFVKFRQSTGLLLHNFFVFREYFPNIGLYTIDVTLFEVRWGSKLMYWTITKADPALTQILIFVLMHVTTGNKAVSPFLDVWILIPAISFIKPNQVKNKGQKTNPSCISIIMYSFFLLAILTVNSNLFMKGLFWEKRFVLVTRMIINVIGKKLGGLGLHFQFFGSL